MSKPNTPSATTEELDAYREGHNAGFKLGIAEGKRALRRELKKQTGDLLNDIDALLTGKSISYCECPPQWMTPALQLIRHGLIERARELQDEGRTQVVQADAADCPDCSYAVQDEGKFVELASEVFTLGHAANCMATGETEGVGRTLNYKCGHCGGSHTFIGAIVDMVPLDEPEEYSGTYLGKLVYCHTCTGGSESAKGITLIVDSTDVCDATQVYTKPLTEKDAADLVLDADPRDVFYPSRRQRRLMS